MISVKGIKGREETARLLISKFKDLDPKTDRIALIGSNYPAYRFQDGKLELTGPRNTERFCFETSVAIMKLLTYLKIPTLNLIIPSDLPKIPNDPELKRIERELRTKIGIDETFWFVLTASGITSPVLPYGKVIKKFERKKELARSQMQCVAHTLESSLMHKGAALVRRLMKDERFRHHIDETDEIERIEIGLQEGSVCQFIPIGTRRGENEGIVVPRCQAMVSALMEDLVTKLEITRSIWLFDIEELVCASGGLKLGHILNEGKIGSFALYVEDKGNDEFELKNLREFK